MLFYNIQSIFQVILAVPIISFLSISLSDLGSNPRLHIAFGCHVLILFSQISQSLPLLLITKES